jgi:hypothetical protein
VTRPRVRRKKKKKKGIITCWGVAFASQALRLIDFVKTGLSRISCAVLRRGTIANPSFFFSCGKHPLLGTFQGCREGPTRETRTVLLLQLVFSCVTDREPVFSERSASFGVAFTSKDGVYLALNATLAAHRRFEVGLDPSAQESTASTNSGSRGPRLTPNTLLPSSASRQRIYLFFPS